MGGTAKYINQNKRIFSFKIRIDYNDGFLYASGSQSKVAGAEKEIDSFLMQEREKFTVDTPKKCIMEFNRTDSHNSVFNKIKDEVRYYELFNKINIEFDDRKIFVSGPESNEKKFTCYIRRTLLSKNNFSKGMDEKKAFIMGGLKPDQIIELNRSHLKNTSSIINCPNLRPFKSMYSELKGLRADMVDALHKLKKEMESGYGELSMKFHFGRVFYNSYPGKYKVSDLERDRVIQYHRLDEELISSTLPFEDWDKQNKKCRYDFKFYTPEPFAVIRYKVYLEVSTDGSTNFQEVKRSKQVMELHEVAPGFLSWPEAGVARFDIVNPEKDLMMRLRIKMFKSNALFEDVVKSHIGYLKEYFFNKLAIIPGDDFLLNIPELNLFDGYILAYCRKSVRETYKVPKTSLQVKVSNETIVVNNDTTDSTTNIFDVFIENVEVTRELDGNRWEPIDIANKFEKVFNFGKELLDQF